MSICKNQKYKTDCKFIVYKFSSCYLIFLEVMVTWLTSDHYYKQNMFYCLPQINNTLAHFIAALIIHKMRTGF